MQYPPISPQKLKLYCKRQSSNTSGKYWLFCRCFLSVSYHKTQQASQYHTWTFIHTKEKYQPFGYYVWTQIWTAYSLPVPSLFYWVYWPFQRENIKHNNIFTSIYILCHLEYTCKILKYTIIHSISSTHTRRHIGFKSPESGWKEVNIKYLSLCLFIFVFFLSTLRLSTTLCGAYRLILKYHRKITDRSISRNAITTYKA